MDRARVWPAFEAAWVLHEDDDVLVIDKPDGVPSQSADPARPDDVLARLRVARGADAYFGVHQRLDRDTSGALLLVKRREANARIAAQFEKRGVEKTYLAAVERWPRGRDRAELRDWVLPGDDGRMRVVERRAKGAQEAVTRVRVVERAADRALLELVLETGRTHQARVQLAHARAPIAGDALYGGARAPRLMLHARSIALLHPTRSGKLHVRAPVPMELEAWLRAGDPGDAIYDDAALFGRAVDRALRRRWGLGMSSEGERATTCFRVINEAGDALPRLAVDAYGDHLVAQLYADDGAGEGEDATWADPARRARVLDRLHAIGFDGVYLKVRPKQANTLVDTRREDLAPREPVRGSAAPDPLVVREEGVPFVVRLGDGLSTGIFLDQRANRVRVRDLAKGGSVVNLFAYTCAFSAVAAVGGAWRTISVDASAAALERGRDNMREAGVLDAAEHVFVAEDAFAWLAAAARKKERHDLVVLDPPSYSTTKKRRFSAESDYAELAAAALAIVRPGGKLFACVNHRGISQPKFRRAIIDGARAARIELAQAKDLPTPSDFPVACGETSHLKCVLATRAR